MLSRAVCILQSSQWISGLSASSYCIYAADDVQLQLPFLCVIIEVRYILMLAATLSLQREGISHSAPGSAVVHGDIKQDISLYC